MKTLALQFSLVATAACCLVAAQPAQAASFTFSGTSGFGGTISGSLVFNEFLTPIRVTGTDSLRLSDIIGKPGTTFSATLGGNAQPNNGLGTNAYALSALTLNQTGAVFNFLNGELVGISGITGNSGAVSRSNTITIPFLPSFTNTLNGTFTVAFAGNQVNQFFEGSTFTGGPGVAVTLPFPNDAIPEQVIPISFTTVQRAIPEPTTVLGLMTAASAGAFFKKRSQKQQAV